METVPVSQGKQLRRMIDFYCTGYYHWSSIGYNVQHFNEKYGKISEGQLGSAAPGLGAGVKMTISRARSYFSAINAAIEARYTRDTTAVATEVNTQHHKYREALQKVKLQKEDGKYDTVLDLVMKCHRMDPSMISINYLKNEVLLNGRCCNAVFCFRKSCPNSTSGVEQFQKDLVSYKDSPAAKALTQSPVVAITTKGKS